MGRVFVSMGMSLDGVVGPAEMADWGKIMAWAFPLAIFRQKLKFGEGGETGPVNDLMTETYDRTGASVMGKRMFDAGEKGWPEEAPFHHPVFVITHEVREPWVRPGGTTFHFVNEPIERVLERARAAAGERDVRIAGGATIARAYLNAGLVDELDLAIAPAVIGRGTRLFEPSDVQLDLELREVITGPRSTHLRYRVRRAG